MKQLTALALCASFLSGCAAAPRLGRQEPVRTTASANTRAAVTEYARSLPTGSRVSITLDGGRQLRGTLMKVTDQEIVLQPRARVPEPPVDVPLAQVRALEIDAPQGTGIGRAIAIGAAVGAGATLAVLMIFAAIYSD